MKWVKYMSNVSSQYVCMSCGYILGEKDRKSATIFKCPSCGRDNFIESTYSTEIIVILNNAHIKRNEHLFDEAFELYSQALNLEPKNDTALWGQILCDYGVTYVYDQDIRKHIPTINRYLEEVVFENKKYKKLLSIVEDEYKRNNIEEEAKYIEQVRLEIAKHINEDLNFDIFICYKKTDSKSKNVLFTEERDKARDIYNLLKNEGYGNVFFAEETLDKNVGAHWEALIYTALKTSKVMLLMCSNIEYLRSSWVRNEWSRYLKNIENDNSRIIIPIMVNNFDPFILPSKLRVFQGLKVDDLNFKEKLLTRLNHKIPLGLKGVITKKKVEVIKDRSIKDRKSIEIVTRKIGGEEVLDYKINASLETEINNIYKLYINRGKYKQAHKRLTNIIKENKLATIAIWGRIIATIEKTDFEELDINYNIKNTFPDFELLMASLPKEDDSYLNEYIKFFFRKLENNIFDSLLFDFILSWKKKSQQLSFSEQVYDYIKDVILTSENKKLFIENYIVDSLNNITKIYTNKQINKLIDMYCDIVTILIANSYFKKALELTKIVLSIDELSTKALLNKMLIDYEVNTLEGLYLKINNDNIEDYVIKLLKSGYAEKDLFEQIIKASYEFLETNKYKKAVCLFDLAIKYIPQDFDLFINEKIRYFADYLISVGKGEEATKYINHVLSIDPKNSELHWSKLKINLGVKSDFELLVKRKKDLNDYQDFKNALNSSDDTNAYSDFYVINDDYKTKAFRKNRDFIRKNIGILNEKFGMLSLRQFLDNTIFALDDIKVYVKNLKEKFTHTLLSTYMLSITLIYFGLLIANTKSIFGNANIANIDIARIIQSTFNTYSEVNILSLTGIVVSFILSIYMFNITEDRKIFKYFNFILGLFIFYFLFALSYIFISFITLKVLELNLLLSSTQLAASLFAFIFTLVIQSAVFIHMLRKKPNIAKQYFDKKIIFNISFILILYVAAFLTTIFIG